MNLKLKAVAIRKLMYADNVVLIAENEAQLQKNIDSVDQSTPLSERFRNERQKTQ